MNIKFTTQIEEVVDYKGNLAFLLNNTKYRTINKYSISDIGYIDKYRIDQVVKIHDNIFHITNQNYLDFKDYSLCQRDVSCSINSFQRKLLDDYQTFYQKFFNELSIYYLDYNKTYFISDFNSYCFLPTSLSRNEIINCYNKVIKKLYTPINIDSFIEISKKYYFTIRLGNHLLPKECFNKLKVKNQDVYYGILPKSFLNDIYYNICQDSNYMFLCLDTKKCSLVLSKTLSNFFNKTYIEGKFSELYKLYLKAMKILHQSN